MALGDYLAKEKKTKASLIKFLKGPAILDLYKFMQKRWAPEKYTGAEAKIKKMLKKERPGTVIGLQECVTYAALHNEDPLCVETIEFLWEIVAYLLQKLALTLLLSAIYISGGVSNYLAPFFKNRKDIFWKHFLNHNQMREQVLEHIQVYVLTENPTLDALALNFSSQ